MQLNNAKNRPFLVAIVVIIGTLGIIFGNGKGKGGLFPSMNNDQPKKQSTTTNNNNTKKAEEPKQQGNTSTNQETADLSYKGKKVRITKHAQCRMECRHLDAFEVDEVIKQNNINQRKSNPNPGGGKCPSVAYEGKTRDGQQARIIVGECDDQPIIITVIDLGNKYDCYCK